MGLISTLIVGLIVGVIARFIMPGEQKMGWIMTTLLGIGGSFVARFVGQALGWYRGDQPESWVYSVVGALVLLLVVNKFRGSSTPPAQ
jgi:uncharacterized membrane protein YeaQ/YmgE (transglycosylase-associated protein family)